MAIRIDYEQLVQSIQSMSREDVTSEILRFNGRFRLDFTEEYLNQISVDRLRHILLAAKMQHYHIN